MDRFYMRNATEVRDVLGRTPYDLFDQLLHCWGADTCAPRMRERWTSDNPTLGQCSITAFLVQDYFGGTVWGVPLGDGNYHCFNRVDASEFDLTCEQFDGRPLDYAHAVEQRRATHFAKPEKHARYELLRERMGGFRSNPQ